MAKSIITEIYEPVGEALTGRLNQPPRYNTWTGRLGLLEDEKRHTVRVRASGPNAETVCRDRLKDVKALFESGGYEAVETEYSDTEDMELLSI